MKRLISVVLAVSLAAGGCRAKQKETNMDRALVPLDSLKITVIYDNKAYQQGLRSDWGFACVVDVAGVKILFDTGAKGDLLLGNIDKLACHPREIEKVVLSHEHWDHVGGLEELLRINSDVKVFVLESFPDEIRKTVTHAGANLIEVSGPQEVYPGIYTTGTMGGVIAEQALVIPTEKGSIVITGCAHPGIVEIVKKAAELTGQDILLVMGGFHLLNHTDTQVEKIVVQFKELGVQYAAPSHCTGDRAIESFAEEYGERFIRVGTGKMITSEDLSASQ